MKKLLLTTALIALLYLSYEGYQMVTDRMKGPRWNNLLPDTKQKTLDLLYAANKAGLDVMFFSGYRTEDDSKKNMDNGTSWVKHPLNSMHCWGAAVDIVKRNAAGFPSWPDPKTPEGLAFWNKLGEIGEELGFVWGGRWKSGDYDHFQLKGLSTADLRTTYNDNPKAFLSDKGVIAA